MVKRIARAAAALLLVVLSIPVVPIFAAVDPPDTLTISNVSVYRNAIEDGDQLYLVSGVIDYTVNPSGYNAYDLFLVRLMDGATELRSTAPYAYYDDGFDYYVVGIYFTAAEVTTFGMGWGDGTGYSMRIDGNPGIDWVSTPSVSVGTFDIWYDGGSVAATTINATLKVRTLALATENTWGVTLTELIAGVRKFNSTGEDYFTTSIPNLRQVTPDLFSQSQFTPQFPDSDLVNIGYTGGDDANLTIYGANWGVQTFTASKSFDIAGVYVKYLRGGTPGNITASIRATAAGVPDGADLTSGTLNANAGVTSGGDWDAIVFDEAISLTSGTVYAIVYRCLTGDVANYVSIRMDSTGTYSGGNVVTSANSGGAWTTEAAKDSLFTIMGDNADNLTWLQQWEGRLQGTPFDMTGLGNIFGVDRMMAGTLIWFAGSFALAFVATRKANNLKLGIIIIGVSMIFGSVFGMVYAIIGIAFALLYLLGALYAVLKPAR